MPITKVKTGYHIVNTKITVPTKKQAVKVLGAIHANKKKGK